MKTLDELRDFMREQAEKDKKKLFVQAVGASLDEALTSASVELGIPVFRLEYEVLQKGSRGIFGLGKKQYMISAYEREKIPLMEGDSGESEDALAGVESILMHEDGFFTIRFDGGTAWLLVAEPRGDGNFVSADEVILGLRQRKVLAYNEEIVRRIVDEHDEEFHKIGKYKANRANDASITIEISDDELKAYANIIAPGEGGMDINASAIEFAIEQQGIIYGVHKNAIEEFLKNPQYETDYLIAEGLPAINGEDGKILYNFKQTTDIDLKPGKDGKINFKELNRFTNVVKGQPLAQVRPPSVGKDGKTVFGRYIPASDGREVEVKLGKNVSLVKNNTVVADESGQVLLLNGKITVETILVIKGDVCAETGNINSLGSVLIEGNVEDGYTVIAQANIEVVGYVGKSTLSAGGDMIIKKGINGGEGTKINAGGSVWASFITNATIESGERVIVSDGIVNCQVIANRKILCKGKRAKIVGGHLRAAEEINAAVLGANGGTETILEVGFDPKTKKEIEEIETKYKGYQSRLDEIDKNLGSLVKLKKQQKKLSQEKERFLLEFKNEHNSLVAHMRALNRELKEKLAYIENLSTKGKVCSSKEVFAGVRIVVKDVVEDVKVPYVKPVTFYQEDGYIVTADYEEIEEDITRKSLDVS